MSKNILIALLCCALLSAFGEQAPEQAGADFVFTNARVYTVNEARPWAEAAVQGNEIVFVGDAAGAEAMVGANTVRHDVRGRLLLPGFVDSHVHPIAGDIVHEQSPE